MNHQELMHHHDHWLVVLSILAAIIAGYAALGLAQSGMRSSDPGERRRRLALAALTMGLGIWTMHFIGMLSLDLGVDISYDRLLVAASLVPAVIGAGVALEVVTKPQAGWPSVFLGAAFMGLAVAAMHYIGMAGLHAPVEIDWNVGLVVLSIAIAYGASLFALGLIHNLHVGQRWRAGPLALAATAFGFGVAGLHYVGMFAASFHRDPGSSMTSGGGGTELLAILLAAGAALMLIVLLFGAALDRQRGAFSRELGVVAEMMRNVVHGSDARASICEAALELSDAISAAVLEPGADGLEVTAFRGTGDVEPDRQRADLAFSGERRFVPGEGQALSALYEPIKLDDEVVGVLFFGWAQSLRELSERSVTIAGLLAAEASFAINRADMVRRLEEQARTDELTGLPNRRTVTAELSRHLDADGGTGDGVGIAMLDIDHFKAFNDRYGHQGGDRLLEAAATAWSAQIREVDMVGRYGGEEFLAVLPGCASESSVATADRLRAVLPVGVTCSAGVAVWDGVETAEELVARADAALYQAKSNGRNRTEAAPDPAPRRRRAAEEAEAAAADPIGRFLTAEGMRAFLDGIPDAFVILDLSGTILDWNAAATLAFGWSSEEALGSTLPELIECEATARALAEAAEGEKRFDGPIPARPRRFDGETFEAELEWFLADVGEGDRIALFIRDVGERHERERLLRRMEDIVAYSTDAVISGDADGRIQTWNPAAERIYGYAAEEMIGEDISRLNPGGEPEGTDQARREAILAGESISMELKELRSDGSVIDVSATVSPLRGEGDEVVGFVLIARDVTERKAAEARLAQAHSQFAGAFDAAAIGMALVSTDGELLAVNPALCSLLQREEQDLRTRTFQELTHPEDLESDLEQFERALSGEIDSYRLSKRYLLPDGGIVWGLLTVTIVRNADGTPSHFVSQIQDIVDRKTAESELRRYANHLEALSGQDPLTGLCNRSGFLAALEEELNVQAAGGDACSVALIAVDGSEPDITNVARGLSAFARSEDLASHLGAGELALLLPGVGEREGEAVLTRARAALRGQPIRCAIAAAREGDEPLGLIERARDGLGAGPEPARELLIPQQVQRLLELARRQLGMPLSFLTRVEGEIYTFVGIAGAREQFGIEEGDSMPFDGSHCVRMLDGRIESTVPDLAADPETRDLEVTRAFSLRAYAGVPVRLRSGEVYGTLCAVDTEPRPDLSQRQVDLLSFVSELTAEAIEAAVEEEEARTQATSAVGVRALLVALEARDQYTGEHSKEVVELASRVARGLGLPKDSIRDVEQVALLHDVGKVGIPDAILQKQGPLDEVEWEVMRKHPIVGERIIVGTPGLSHLAPAMRSEHERWDGRGYPDGLAGEAIPIASRITLACDAFHAMTSDRPYRPAMSVAQACEELRRNAGSQFDPAVVDVLLAEIERMHEPAAVGGDEAAENGDGSVSRSARRLGFGPSRSRSAPR